MVCSKAPPGHGVWFLSTGDASVASSANSHRGWAQEGGELLSPPRALSVLAARSQPTERRRTAGLVPPLPRRHGDVEGRRGPGMCSAPHCRLRFPQVPPKGCCVLAPCLHPTTPAPPCSGEPGGQSLRGHRGQGQPGPGTRKGQHRQLCKQGGTLALRAH